MVHLRASKHQPDVRDTESTSLTKEIVSNVRFFAVGVVVSQYDRPMMIRRDVQASIVPAKKCGMCVIVALGMHSGRYTYQRTDSTLPTVHTVDAFGLSMIGPNTGCAALDEMLHANTAYRAWTSAR